MALWRLARQAWHGKGRLSGRAGWSSVARSTVPGHRQRFSHSVMSNSLRPHELQHTRLLCPPLFPVVRSVSCPLSQWCYVTISSSAASFSFCFRSFPASESFLMSQLLASGDQIVGTSASASVLPMNIQDWFPLGLMDLILLSKGLSRVFSSTTVQKVQFFGTQPSLLSSSHIYTWLLEKQYLWLYGPMVILLAKWCFCFLICCLGLS